MRFLFILLVAAFAMLAETKADQQPSKSYLKTVTHNLSGWLKHEDTHKRATPTGNTHKRAPPTGNTHKRAPPTGNTHKRAPPTGNTHKRAPPTGNTHKRAPPTGNTHKRAPPTGNTKAKTPATSTTKGVGSSRKPAHNLSARLMDKDKTHAAPRLPVQDPNQNPAILNNNGNTNNNNDNTDNNNGNNNIKESEKITTCHIGNDLAMTSSQSKGQEVGIFNPCGQVLAVIEGRTTNSKDKCRVTVRSADLAQKGQITTGMVEVSFQIASFKANSILLNGDKFFHSEATMDPSKATWLSLTDRSNATVKVKDEKVAITVDRHSGLWTASGCGTVVSFRRDKAGGKPGIWISSKFDNSRQPTDAKTVCNLLSDTRLHGYHSQAALYLATSLLHKTLLDLKLSSYSDSCQKASTTFTSKCLECQRAKAFKYCTFVLDDAFRVKAFNNGNIDGAKLMNIFAQCLDAFCDGDQKWCFKTKETSFMLQCPLSQMRCLEFKKPHHHHHHHHHHQHHHEQQQQPVKPVPAKKNIMQAIQSS